MKQAAFLLPKNPLNMSKMPLKTHTKMPPKRHRYFYGAFPVMARACGHQGRKLNQARFFIPVAGVASLGQCHFVCRCFFAYSLLSVAFSAGFCCRGGQLTCFLFLARFRGILCAFLSAGVPAVYLTP